MFAARLLLALAGRLSARLKGAGKAIFSSTDSSTGKYFLASPLGKDERKPVMESLALVCIEL